MRFQSGLTRCMAESIPVEVVYAEPDNQVVISLSVVPGTTLIEAVELSGISTRFPGVLLMDSPKGVYGVRKPDDYVLQEHDRVEIYRPLTTDPREARRKRAQKN